MDPNKIDVSRLESLPEDLLGVIVRKLGATDTTTYHFCLRSCKKLGATAHDERVCTTVNLAPLVKRPLLTVKYFPVLKRCLAHYNPDAHYIKGILRYFLLNQSTVGLHHLDVAADAGKKDAIYLYAILLLCRDMIAEGKTYLNQLKWEENTDIVDACWKSIKTSSQGIRVGRKRCYLVSLEKMKPYNFCHLNDLDTTCAECFYYKKMKKFIYII
ncbi:unnamed protein product [Arabis nemorensis]|uniref:At2g35280-like TPR domain-containing protein n=1 Tax=Arabis nemorensis TaxID=586526 RepID=A0A565CW22_9BRAS|nr:unnamed protein product [Arabis nemorensis]